MAMRGRKAQTAAEYLLAYGWTLILVGIIIFALFELGFFAGSNFATRAQPDTCTVVKTINSSPALRGDCSGQLPQSVASFNPLLGSSYISGASGGAFPSGHGAFSEFAWVNTLNNNQETIFAFGGTAQGAGIVFSIAGGVNSGTLLVSDFYKSISGVVGGVNDGNWHFVGVVHPANSSEFDMFVDGQWSNSSIPGSVDLYNSGSFWIGSEPVSLTKQYQYSGQIANIQLYNTSLNGQQVENLWLGGIGAAPSTTEGLAGWWPLNGNGDDYSGNGQVGIPYNVTFVTTWTGTYTAPSLPQ